MIATDAARERRDYACVEQDTPEALHRPGQLAPLMINLLN
jgi:hypothetical protein